MKSKNFVIALVFIVFLCVLYLFRAFLLSIAIGVLFAVSTASLHAKIKPFCKKKHTAALIMTILVAVLFFVPLSYAGFSFASALKHFDLNAAQEFITKLKHQDFLLSENLEFLRPKLQEFFAQIDINSLSKNVLNYASNFTKSGAKFFTELILIIIFYFFANYYASELLLFLKQLIPLSKKDFESVFCEVANVLSVVFYTVIITAVFEGVLFAICVMNFGYDALLMGILYAISSLIPVIGGALMWLPLALLEYSNHHTLNAVFIALYSVIIISIVADTFVKPFIIKWLNEKLLKTPAKINELLIFFAMIAGIATFGFWGVILGPAIVALFLSVAKLYILIVEKKDEL